MLSGDRVQIRGKECVLTVLRDITEKKRIEDLLRLRLDLWEFSTQHTIHEIIEKGLDGIESITGSQYSFFRYGNRDQKEEIIDDTSVQTQIDLSYNGEENRHPFNRASICENAIQQKKPIVINDFSTVPGQDSASESQLIITRELVIPMVRDDQVAALLGLGNKAQPYDKMDLDIAEHIVILLWSLVSQKRSEEKILELNSQLEYLAMVDELTGLPNRRSFFNRGNIEISRSRRYQVPLSLIMLDIDHFKVINDTYGHEAGDITLHQLAAILRKYIRDVDLPARLGGEEFGILLPNTRQADAAVLAERLRKAVAEECCQYEGTNVPITGSFGVAEFEMEMKNLDELFRAADTAMYQAKYRGRNQVALAE